MNHLSINFYKCILLVCRHAYKTSIAEWSIRVTVFLSGMGKGARTNWDILSFSDLF
jgi:hypothetical protein